MSSKAKYKVTVATSGQEADCEADQSLLDSCLRSDVWLPYACNQGTCGTCKVQVLKGKVDHRASSTETLELSERSEGVALACQASPKSDIEIKPLKEVAEGQPRFRLQDFMGTVVSVEDIAEDTRRVIISLDKPMQFAAGQYAELTVPGSGIKRHYSMANAPSEQNVLEFQIRRVPGGLATHQWIFRSLDAGDEITLSGPYGEFVFAEEDDLPMILIGGGTGMAPLMSIMDHALAQNPAREIHLYQGARSTADIYDVERLQKYADTFTNVYYVPALNIENWNGRQGHITDVMLEDFTSCKGYSGYLCGPPPMVDAGIKAFKRKRMAPRRIYREKFTPAESRNPEFATTA